MEYVAHVDNYNRPIHSISEDGKSSPNSQKQEWERGMVFSVENGGEGKNSPKDWEKKDNPLPNEDNPQTPEELPPFEDDTQEVPRELPPFKEDEPYSPTEIPPSKDPPSSPQSIPPAA